MKTKKEKRELPPLVTEADTKWPSYDANEPWRVDERADWPMSLTYYQIGGKYARSERGWVIVTLGISKGRRGNADRTYAVQLADEKVCRVGQGPHVVQTVTVYLHAGNADRLAKHVELYFKGLGAAGEIRDRISSRRAQGQLHRAAGRTSWMW